ncbi:unnamed protein product [Rotaria socialis]|uniref:Leucine-rich repeat domain-containing protein n=1 Tax=Rotaria socialis TaxID=392032 RepID=A0A820DW76_9BILA|nr:unnamed protein product [Rotaria socialis]
MTSLPSVMSSLTGLNTLYLQSNPLTSIDELNSLSGWQHLFGIGSLGRSSGWKTFDFSYNELDLIPPEIYNIFQ